ncbi:MAG TPA: MBL fold metallo-hydrolase, partial [Luteimonas sp.]|nr:MBL fold metallo-hydrolase [Luteimonas sp.]
MLAVEMLPGGHGDALVVEYGSGTRLRRLLIDAGTAHSYEAVRKRLLERRDQKYEAFVVTHIDEDHIGGAVHLLNDPDLRHRIDHVWFNGYVHSERGGNVLGPLDGERLTRAIADGGYRWNAPFP